MTVLDSTDVKDEDLGILVNFKFDCVYTLKDDQVDVIADASPMAISVLDRYNVCMFTYGQTGTGRTLTEESLKEKFATDLSMDTPIPALTSWAHSCDLWFAWPSLGSRAFLFIYLSPSLILQ